LTGCPTDAGTDEPEGTPGSETVTGGGGGVVGGDKDDGSIEIKETWTTAELRKVLNGNAKYLKVLGDVTLADDGVTVDFTGVKVAVDGTVTTTGTATTFNAAKAAELTFGSSGSFALEQAGDVFIYPSSFSDTSKIRGSGKGIPVETSPLNAAIDTNPKAVTSFDLTTANAAHVDNASSKLYVTDTLTIPATGIGTPTGDIIPLGDVVIAATATANLAKVSFSSVKELKFTGTNGITLTLPATLKADTVTIGDKDLTLAGVTSLTTGTLTGTKTLTLSANVTNVDIGGGEGKVAFMTGTPALVVSKFGNSGGVSFGAAASISDTAANFAGLVAVDADVTLGANAKVTFNKNVILADTKKIVFNGTTNVVTLKKDASIALKDANTTPLLIADTDTTLTAAGATTLTAATTGTKLTIGVESLTVTGTLSVPSAATLELGVGTKTLKVVGTLSVAGTASIVATGIVDLPESSTLATSGTGKVTFGATEFSGVGAWTASATGGTAEAGVSGVKITSAAADAGATIALVAGSGTRTASILTASGTNPTITQKKGAGNNLTIGATITIDLKGTLSSGTSIGSIVLEEDTTASQGGKITFSAGTSIVKVGSEADGTVLAAAAGLFVTTAAANKIAVSDFANVLIYPGVTTAGKVNTIKGGTTSGTLQAFGGTSGTGSSTINASAASN
jgi:hypothetical protein